MNLLKDFANVVVQVVTFRQYKKFFTPVTPKSVETLDDVKRELEPGEKHFIVK